VADSPNGTPPSRPRLGGMALANGLLVHGPTHWAAAIQRADGSIAVASGRKPRFNIGAIGDLPVVRGVLRIGESVAVLPVMRRNLPEARFAIEEREAAYTVVGAFLTGVVARRRLRWPIAQETVSAVVGLAPAIVSLRTSRAAAWHAVEHKSIAAYEAGGLAEVARAGEYPKEHPRCGSNLIAPMMVATIGTNLLLRALPTDRRPGMRTVAGVIGIGAAVEVFSFASRHPEHLVARGIHGIGYAIQATIATKEPEESELLVGAAALHEICRVEGISAGTAV
jgi:uncharacterized protein YqhQ